MVISFWPSRKLHTSVQFRYDESLPEVDLDCRTTLDYVLQMEEVQELSLIFFCFSFYKIESFNAQCEKHPTCFCHKSKSVRGS